MHMCMVYGIPVKSKCNLGRGVPRWHLERGVPRLHLSGIWNAREIKVQPREGRSRGGTSRGAPEVAPVRYRMPLKSKCNLGRGVPRWHLERGVGGPEVAPVRYMEFP